MRQKIYYNSVNLALSGNYKHRQSLIKRFSSWENVWRNLPDNIKKDRDPKSEYEKLLAPHGIYVRAALPSGNTLAIVGTRRATPEGQGLAISFDKELCSTGFTIVSGLAYGIDSAAHR